LGLNRKFLRSFEGNPKKNHFMGTEVIQPGNTNKNGEFM
jgi:hypothetical protein